MRPPCEIVVRYVLPTFRSLVAKKLVKDYSFTQTTAAKKLGTTQAAISYYLYSKRGKARSKQLESVPAIKSVTNEVAQGIATNKLSPIDSMLLFCKLCVVLRKENVICEIHKDLNAIPSGCTSCST